MDSQPCTRCGSKYTSFKRKEETVDAILYVFYCENCKKEFTIQQKIASSSSEWLMTIKDDGEVAMIYKSGNGFTVVQTESKGFKNEESLRKSMTPEVVIHDVRQILNTTKIYGDPYSIKLSTFIDPFDSTGIFINLKDIELNSELTESALNNPAMQVIHVRDNKFACKRSYANTILINDIAAWFNQVLYVPGSRTNASSGGCYIATCVYGSYNCPQVWTLRRFRDNILAESWYGKVFIRFYYAISPTLVKWFGNTKWFKLIFTKTLDKMVRNLQEKGIESTSYQDKIW